MTFTDRNNTLERELDRGERILWKGRPARGIRLRSSDLFMIPFSLVWSVLAISNLAPMLISGKADPAFSLVGLLFIVVAIYISVGRFIVDAIVRASTEYAITDRRVIIKSGFFSRKVTTINMNTMPEVSLTEKSNGSGTILFGDTGSWRAPAMSGFYMPGYRQPPALEMIRDVRKAYALLTNARGAAA